MVLTLNLWVVGGLFCIVKFHKNATAFLYIVLVLVKLKFTFKIQGSSGVNANYANDIDVLVPNIKPDTSECIKLYGDPDPKVLKDERFKSEMNIENAYAGYSSRKVIMEERNLYCGSYNVLVLVNE